MWIFCCGMPRSGSTLQFQITATLVENAGLGKRLEWCDPSEFPGIREKYSQFRGWKVFKSHVATDEIMKEFYNQNALGVYIFRDIRDVVASHMRKYSTPFNKILQIKFIERWINNYYKWTSLPKVLVSKYEDTIADIGLEIKKIAEHLDIRLSKSKCDKIALEFQLSNQQSRIDSYKKTLLPDQLVRGGTHYEPHSLLHIDHITSGKIGSWKDTLSLDEIKIIEEKTKTWMDKNGYVLSVLK